MKLMKTLIMILSILLAIAIIPGCDHANSSSINSINESTVNIPPSNLIKFEGPNQTSSEVCKYLTFEEHLAYATDLMEGVFIGCTVGGTLCYYEFEILKDLRGNMTGKKISVQFSPSQYTFIDTGIKYSTYNIRFETGKSYLLLLDEYSSVYSESTSFSFVNDSLIIPLENISNTGYYAEKAELYGTPLTNHIKTKAALAAFNNGSLESYILKQISSNPYVTGDNYITATDINSVINGSDYVLEITVNKVAFESYTGDRTTYTCTINEILKGNLDINVPVSVIFPKNSVKQNDKCIVAVNGIDGSNAILTMSSKKSIFKLSQKETIKNIIEN